MEYASPALAIIAAYVLGSISFAMVSSTIFGLADPRTYGSGNPGATNVLRSGHKKAAILTLVGDVLKGWIAVFAAQKLGFNNAVIGLVALAVFFGHIFPVFLKFKGGKGVATGAGVLLALNPLLGLAVAATWLFVAFAFRYSSLAAVAASVLAPVFQILVNGGNGQTVVVSIIAMALVGKHWQNIQRLLAGQEARIGSKKK